ncbi:MAG: TonB-dependent receptor [Sphingobium sp.]
MKTGFMLFSVSTLAFAQAAYAADEQAEVAAAPEQAQLAEAAPAMGEIVVTANRRVQNAQDVPISVAVLSSESLVSAGVSNATQLQVSTPGLNIATAVGAPIIFIRGMGTANLVAEGAVGLYLDGVYLPYSGAVDQSFLDMQRVEVLKGPQGTLYGRNTTAGAINLVTRDPSEKETVELAGTLGTWGTRRVQAYASSGPGPVAVSVAGQYTHHDAYMKNRVPGRHDLNDRDEFGFRAKLKAELSDGWTATVSADYTEADDYGSIGWVSIYDRNYAADPANGGRFTTLEDDPRHTYSDFPSDGHELRNYGGSLTIRGDLGFADLVSITGYRNVFQRTAPDSDASDLPLTNFNNQNRFKNWSQELQLISAPSSPVEWIVGLYMFDLKSSMGPTGAFNIGNTGGPSIDEASLIVYGRTGTRSYAAYSQVSVPIFGGFSVTGGLRYSNEKPRLYEQNVTIPGLGVILADAPDSAKYDSFDPKIGLEYEFAGQLLYGSYTKGFRSGSYNLGSPGSPGPVHPEKVDAFEVGGKHRVVSGVLFNWALWHYKYKDLQVSRVLQSDTGSLFTNQNAASAKSQGAEATLIVNAVRNLSLSLGASYIDATYEDFPDAAAFVPNPAGYGLVREARDISGERLPRAPKFTLTGQATYTIPIGDGSLELGGNVYYTSKYFLDTPSNIAQKGYTLVNANAKYTLPGGQWSIAAFVNNLTNEVYANAYNANVYNIGALPGDPRVIGGTISFKY